jgi:hypothetical protein
MVRPRILSHLGISDTDISKALNPYAPAREQVLLGLVAADILPLVFEYLWSAKKESKANLRHAALTCRAFSKPALDRLWSELESLDPLLVFMTPTNACVSS